MHEMKLLRHLKPNRLVVVISCSIFGLVALSVLTLYRMTNPDPGVVEFVLGPWDRYDRETPKFPLINVDEKVTTSSSQSSSSIKLPPSSSSSSNDGSTTGSSAKQQPIIYSVSEIDPPEIPSSINISQLIDLNYVTHHHSNGSHSRHKRQVPCQRGEELDEYVDSLFRFASRLIRAMEPFTGTIPNVTLELPEYNVIIFLHSGGATHAYTIQRKKPAWVLCQNGSISLGLTVGFEELRIMFKYRVIQDWKLIFDGELEAQIAHPKIQIQFTQTTPDEDSEESVQQRVDALRVWSVGHIRIMLKGLGNLTQAISLFLTGFLNRNIDSLMPTLRDAEGQIIGFINNALQNISIPFFSII